MWYELVLQRCSGQSSRKFESKNRNCDLRASNLKPFLCVCMCVCVWGGEGWGVGVGSPKTSKPSPKFFAMAGSCVYGSLIP